MLEPPRISPLPASARSCCAAVRPLPRSSRMKHLDCDTNTLISASGDSRLYASHHLFSGSATESEPIFLSQVGISGGGGSAPHAATVAHRPETASNAATALFRLLWGTMNFSQGTVAVRSGLLLTLV